MKIVIMSDCHANIDGLNAMWEKESDSDYIVFAGDMIDFGYNPKESVRWFMDKKDKLFAVLGNHDEGLVKAHKEDPTKPQVEKPFNFAQLAMMELDKEEWDFLESIPHENTFTIGDRDFYMCHFPDQFTNDEFYHDSANPWQQRELFDRCYNEKFTDAKAEKRTVVWGHSHNQWVVTAAPGWYTINPGSMSYRFNSLEPIRCSDYIVLQDDAILLKHVDYDTTHLYNKADMFTDTDAQFYGKHFYRKVDKY